MSSARSTTSLTSGSRPRPTTAEGLTTPSSRRHFLRHLTIFSLLASFPLASSTLADSPADTADKPKEKGKATEKFTLASAHEPGEVRQVTLKIEAAGDLKLNADGQKVVRRPVQVAAEFAYEETTAPNKTPVRHYTQAAAKMCIRDSH